MPFPTDLEIAQAASMLPIGRVAQRLGIDQETIEPYGHYKAKLPLSLINEGKAARSKLILVTAISPTPAGDWGGDVDDAWGAAEGWGGDGALPEAALQAAAEQGVQPVAGWALAVLQPAQQLLRAERKPGQGLRGTGLRA